MNTTARMEACTPEGYGICRIDGRAVFVPGALENETWDIHVLKVTETAVYAKGTQLLSPSPRRIPQDCPNPCGGCTMRHADYEEELRLKRNHVNDCFRRIGGLDYQVDMIHPSPAVDRYRNKAVFSVSQVEGKAEFGFYRPRSHTLVPVQDCLLQDRNALLAAQSVIDFMNQHGIPAYDEQNRKGTVRHLSYRSSRCFPDAVLTIVSARGFGAKTETLIHSLLERCPFLSGIVLNVNKSQGNTILSGDFHLLWGEADIRETLCGVTYSVSPQAFFQINPAQAEAIYQKAISYAACPPNKIALDLYCGAGTITLCLATTGVKVIGVEIVPEAIENARANAVRNSVQNASFFCGDTSDIAARLKEEGTTPGVVILDPPRKGLEENVIRSVCAMDPERIVYVSCNPATLARDLARFSEQGYSVKAAEVYDMFPRTAHVETVCLLMREKV